MLFRNAIAFSRAGGGYNNLLCNYINENVNIMQYTIIIQVIIKQASVDMVLTLYNHRWNKDNIFLNKCSAISFSKNEHRILYVMISCSLRKAEKHNDTVRIITRYSAQHRQVKGIVVKY